MDQDTLRKMIQTRQGWQHHGGKPRHFSGSNTRRDKIYVPKLANAKGGRVVRVMQHSGTVYEPNRSGWRRVTVKEAAK